VIVCLLDHLSKFFQSKLAPFECVERFPNDVFLGIKLTCRDLGLYSLLQIRRKLV
jgi:hypothetical protein